VIQATLRHELKSDVTVITIAHRLQTIMNFDKIVSKVHMGVVSCLYPLTDGARGRETGDSESLQKSGSATETPIQVEFDAPLALLKKEGHLKQLVDESVDRETLYTMVRNK
jgi:hypothetical protein